MVAIVHKHRLPTKGEPLLIYPKQAEFLASEAFIRGFVGGRGAGKSFIGGYDILRRAKRDRLYLVGAPTYPMLRDASFRSFVAVAERLGRLKRKKSGSELYACIYTDEPHLTPRFGEAEVIFRSTSDPDKFRGPNLSGVWMDECSVALHEAFNTAAACLREGGEMGFFSLTFTPRGRSHWTYKMFFDEEGKPKPNTFLARSTTDNNPFLPKEFRDIIAAQYTLEMQRQELGGEFVDAVGLLFRREWFKFLKAMPDDSQIAKRVRYWDKAATPEEENPDADWSVGVLMARTNGGQYIIEDIVRGQWTPFARNQVILNTATADAAKYNNTVEQWIEQEPGSGGKESAMISVRELAGYPVWTETVSKDKFTRARPMAAQAEAGNVYMLVDNEHRARNAEILLDEYMQFPQGEHDDTVDGGSGAFNKLSLSFGVSVGTEPLICYPMPGEKLDVAKLASEASHPGTKDLLTFLSRRR